ncbi:MAG: hypothetical protein WC397_03945 [Candidatus Paceibacterota bacterium]|jgi:hypothetical protein
MNILNNLIADARRDLLGREKELRIDNIIIGETLYTMKDCNTVFTDMKFCLVLFENAYGFSYFQEKIDYSPSNFVNKNALDVIGDAPVHMQVAITDALYCLINEKDFKNKLLFTGNIRQKGRKRANALLAHIPNGSKILLLGAAAEIIEEAKIKNCHIKVLDLEEQKIGLGFYSTDINDGKISDIQKEIKETDYVVATGMIFVSQTADKIFELSRENGKNLTLYMETGSNFGPQLVGYGADTVLSEFFPYYDFFGDTKYLIFRKEEATSQ